MTRLLSLLVLLLIAPSFKCMMFSEPEHGLCHRSDCKCPDAGHPSWVQVNCNVSATQKLDIFEGDIPEVTANIVIQGPEALMIGPGALSRLQDLRQLSISGAKLIVLRSGAAMNLNVINAYIEIEDCEVLRVEERAFSNIRGPLSVFIRNCEYVSLEGEAFSWLLKMNITNVKTLTLSPRAFMLDSTAANVGEHGPGMSIMLTNLSTPEIPKQTFGSSAAEILLTSVQVRVIRQGAFSANTYNVVKAVDCSFHLIEEESFASKSLINNLDIHGCRIHQFESKALQSAMSKLTISRTRFDIIKSGAINATVVSVKISDCEFHKFYTRGFELSSWSKLTMERNKIDDLPPNAIVAPASRVGYELFFVENEIETVDTNSLGFIGQTVDGKYAFNVVYKNNYYGVQCHCNISLWLASAMGSKSGEPFNTESYCTVNEFFARCFNVPQQNMVFGKFFDKVCTDNSYIKCEEYKRKTDVPTEIKNPRFPHKKDDDSLSDRDKKVIGIVIVSALGCVIIVMLISLFRWMKRRGHCASLKNILIPCNSSCGTLCGRLCVCGRNNGIDNARSISQLSVNEYSERRRLNEPRIPENMVMETVLSGYPEEVTTPMDDKTTQTLPEELTKELLENLKEKLEDPENYVEAREMIEHLYELIKVEESCNSNSPVVLKQENIYEVPFQNTSPRIGKNKMQMISIGTKTPSLDKLLPLSPYNRQTALAHEYFEPKDFAVHLYAEITNYDKEKRYLLGTIPDLVEQVVPRGPYLRAIRVKNSSPTTSPSSIVPPPNSPISSPSSSNISSPLQSPSTIKSIKSTTSNSSDKMMNRPLPEKPVNLDPGEGSSVALG